jgi:RNA polymerase sigma factor (sigma-70 family)
VEDLTMPDGYDAELVRAALGGDSSAFDKLACRYRAAAMATAFHRLGEFEAARDAVQEALVTAYLELPMLRDPARFGHWLQRITIAAALSELRRRRPALRLDSPEVAIPAGPESDPALALERSERAQQVRGALAVLPERDRQAVILHYVTGYSHAEIGGFLGTSVSAVKSRLHRARRRLREEMVEMMEGDLKSQTPAGVEFNEESVRVALRKIPEHQIAVLERWLVPFPMEFTRGMMEAISKVAAELKAEGYRWLFAPPHIPDGSPALGMLKGMGFQVELEMHWYERSLKGRLPKVPALDAGFQVRGLADAEPSAMTRLLQATVSGGSPVRFTEEGVGNVVRSDNRVHEASFGAYQGDRLAAFVLAFGTRDGNAKYGRGTGVLWWAVYHPDVGSARLLKHLIALSLMPLRRAGFERVVMDQLQPKWDRDRELMTILEELGFHYVRSQWNLKLDLQAWKDTDRSDDVVPAVRLDPSAGERAVKA